METWKRASGFFGPNYDVSDQGRVRRADDFTLMVGGVSGAGYRCVVLSRDGAQRTHDVHVLVCEAFHGPRPTTPLAQGRWEVRHLNGDKLDNRAVNLAWGSSKANSADRVEHGTVLRGEDSPTARLGERSVATMRRLRDEGFKLAEIAERFGVCESQVHNVVSGAQWSHTRSAPAGDWRPLGLDGYDAYVINRDGRLRRKTDAGHWRTITGEPSTGRATLLHADGTRHRHKISTLVERAFADTPKE